MAKHEELEREIQKKFMKKSELGEQENYLIMGVKRILKRDNAFIKSALEIFLSNRINFSEFIEESAIPFPNLIV